MFWSASCCICGGLAPLKATRIPNPQIPLGTRGLQRTRNSRALTPAFREALVPLVLFQKKAHRYILDQAHVLRKPSIGRKRRRDASDSRALLPFSKPDYMARHQNFRTVWVLVTAVVPCCRVSNTILKFPAACGCARPRAGTTASNRQPICMYSPICRKKSSRNGRGSIHGQLAAKTNNGSGFGNGSSALLSRVSLSSDTRVSSTILAQGVVEF